MKVIVRKDMTFGTQLARKGQAVTLKDSQAKELIERGLAFPEKVGGERKTKENKQATTRKNK